MTGVMTGLPAFSDINLARMLHGEQYIEIKKNFPTSGRVHSCQKDLCWLIQIRNTDSQRCY